MEKKDLERNWYHNLWGGFYMRGINNQKDFFEERKSKRPEDVSGRIKFGIFWLIALFMLLFFVFRFWG